VSVSAGTRQPATEHPAGRPVRRGGAAVHRL